MEEKNSFCPECGSKINENDKFCQNCGQNNQTSAIKIFPVIGEIILFLALSSILAIPFAIMLGEELYSSMLKGNGILVGYAIGLSTGIIIIFSLWNVFKFNCLEKRIAEIQEKINKEQV